MNCLDLFVKFILVLYSHLTDFQCKCVAFFQNGNQWQTPTDAAVFSPDYSFHHMTFCYHLHYKYRDQSNAQEQENIKNKTTFKHRVVWQHTDGTHECWVGSRFREDDQCWVLVPASASVWLSRRLLWLTVSTVTLMSCVEGESGSSSTACHASRPTSASFR